MAELELNRCVVGDARKVLLSAPAKSVHCCVTSPPYWHLRDYGHPRQIGIEQTPAQYVGKLVRVFREVRRVLRDDGTLWLNLGDTYAAGGNGGGGSFVAERRAWKGAAAKKGWRSPTGKLKRKDLVGIPWKVAFALQADGWYLRCDIVWSKLNPAPDSARDRPARVHEYVFLLSKRPKYHFDPVPLMEPSVDELDVRNGRSVWTIPTQPFEGAHFATMPEELVQRCVLAGCPAGGIVLDPFMGSGTVGQVAERNDRRWLGIELVRDYAKIAAKRTAQVGFVFTEAAP